MATRGIVAVGTKENWRGVYNHYDSYPTGLGRDLFEHIKTQSDVQTFANNLLQFDDWRNYLRGGICPYCGKKTTQPHSITGILLRETEEGVFLDPNGLYHKHHTAQNQREFTPEQIAHTDCEWLYVVEAETNQMHVFELKRQDGAKIAHLKASVDLTADAPRWAAL